jgi:hypothetical protein
MRKNGTPIPISRRRNPDFWESIFIESSFALLGCFNLMWKGSIINRFARKYFGLDKHLFVKVIFKIILAPPQIKAALTLGDVKRIGELQGVELSITSPGVLDQGIACESGRASEPQKHKKRAKKPDRVELAPDPNPTA